MRLPPGPFLLQRLNKMATNTTTTTPQLAHLPEVERLSPACIRILGGNPGKFTLQGTNTYLVGTGRERLLIDTGEGKASWIAALRRVLAEEQASVTAAILTHWHPDHTGGAADVAAAWPAARIYKHQPQPGQQGREQNHHQQQQQQQPPPPPPHKQQQYLNITDGQQFAVEGATLTAHHTPGHTADHVVLALAEEDALFTGDSVLGHGTAVFEDLGAYMRSLERMAAGLFRGRAYPGHGPVVPDGPGRIAEYIRHRRQREEQVVQMLRDGRREAGNGGGGGGGRQEEEEEGGGAAVEDGEGEGEGEARTSAWTAMELVRAIYRDVPESLHPAAAGGVVQILRKLEREGKVATEGNGERWRLVASGRPAL